MPFAIELATQVASNDQALVRAMKALYDANGQVTVAEGFQNEQRAFVAHTVSAEEIAKRRAGVVARGRDQINDPGQAPQ